MRKQKKDNLLDALEDIVYETDQELGLSAAAEDVVKTFMNTAEKVLSSGRKSLSYTFAAYKDKKIGRGTYSIRTKTNAEEYNTLLEQPDSRSFVLHVYSEDDGEIGTISRHVTGKKSLFSYEKETTDFLVTMNGHVLGYIIPVKEKKERKLITDFNSWAVMGSLSKNDYKIFDTDSGKTLADVSARKVRSASFAMKCRRDENEPLLVMMAVLIDFLSSKK
ncbi:MAG: hypothetical protein IKF00_05040 [Solobacterium sp.]|nr:hypothetical protein [Solobacterium sp.]